MAAIATVTGTAIRPGVSRNNRLYTAEAIGSAVRRAQQRIADGGMPLTTLTHHEAGDDSTRIVGRITSLTHEADGSAKYTAVLTDTAAGRDIHSLISGPDPVLRGVSIRGAWLGRVRREQHEGRTVETADDLELDGLDYTRKPGVDGAWIESVDPLGSVPRESDGSQRVPITESVEATVEITEAQTPAVSKRTSGLKGDGDRSYADPGYLADKKQRYDVSTKAKAKAAWSYVNQKDNARKYSSAQLKRVKQRIVKALKGFGVTVATQEGWLIDPAVAISESLAECWDMPGTASSLYVSLTNGPTTVTVSSSLLDAHDLDAVGRAAMQGAVNACLTLDPDLDADIDVPGADDEDTDKDMHDDEETGMATEPGSACACGCGCAVPHPMAVAGGCPCGCGCETCKAPGADAGEAAESAPTTETTAPDSAAATQEEEEPAMAESTTPAAEAPASDSGIDALSAKFDKLTDAITGLVTSMAPKPVEAAPVAAAPVAEAALVVQETQEQMIARLVAEGVKAALPQAVQEHVEQSGPPTRKGLVAQQVSESGAQPGAGLNENGLPSDWPNKPLHEYSPDERAQYFGPALRQHVLGDRFRG
jgi:hypothetical protein